MRSSSESSRRDGHRADAWDTVLDLDPGYFKAYLDLSSPNKPALDAKVRELICVAVDISATHMYRPGARIHIRRALELGATAAELMEVFELASLIGVHSVVEGARLLAENKSANVHKPTEHRAERRF